MTIPLLKVSNLHTQFGTGDNAVKAVDGIDFTINKGETFVLLGESGCGKSVTALSIIRLLPSAAKIMEGSIHLYDQNLFELPEYELRKIRGNRIAMIFQEPQSSLNPVLTAGQQIGETLKQHKGIKGKAQRRQVIELLDAVGIPQPQQRIDEYPHQFSGGMKQRIMIAIALAGEPELLIADEPTTALDVTIQAQVLELLQQLQKDTGMAMLFITHDLGVASNIADHIGVMYDGKIVEQKSSKEFFSGHKHPYSQQLFDALPSKEKRNREAMGKPQRHKRQAVPILRVRDLKVYFPIKKGLFKRTVGYVRAVDGVSIEISSGETVAVVGESGSGKTTMGKGILQLFRPTEGSVVFEGEELTTMSDKELRSRRSDIQIIFQDPYSSMNPRMMIVDIIEE
ncbi:MAG: ABC transporter ATP-binding protein, partial [Proteobacteria bacterium]|nr:ABC transporter ATP-binding protein [Pseudomonadota bacterium]